MHTLVVDHPLVAHKMSRLRREETSSATFRLLAEELVTLLAYEATRGLEVGEVPITTPVSPTVGQEMTEPCPSIDSVFNARWFGNVKRHGPLNANRRSRIPWTRAR